MSEWQTIDSAPKDGRPIIACDAKFRVRAVWYFAPSSNTYGWRTWENTAWFQATHWLCQMPDMRRIPMIERSLSQAGDEAA